MLPSQQEDFLWTQVTYADVQCAVRLYLGEKHTGYLQQHQLLNLMLQAVLPPAGESGNKNSTQHGKIDKSLPTFNTMEQVTSFLNR